MEKRDPPVESGKLPLRPRWGVWLRSAAWSVVPTLVLSVYAAVRGRGAPPPLLGYFIAYLILQVIAIWREYRNRPPVLRYWTDQSEFPLTVR